MNIYKFSSKIEKEALNICHGIYVPLEWNLDQVFRLVNDALRVFDNLD